MAVTCPPEAVMTAVAPLPPPPPVNVTKGVGSSLPIVQLTVVDVELSASVGSTCTTSVKLPDVAPPLMTLLVVQVNEPVPPTAGGVQIHPAGAVIETNVVFVGIVSVSVIVADVACVLTFVTSWVY